MGGSLEATHIERGKPRFRKGPEIPVSSTLSGQSGTSEMPVLVWPSSSVRAWNRPHPGYHPMMGHPIWYGDRTSLSRYMFQHLPPLLGEGMFPTLVPAHGHPKPTTERPAHPGQQHLHLGHSSALPRPKDEYPTAYSGFLDISKVCSHSTFPKFTHNVPQLRKHRNTFVTSLHSH